MLVVPLGALFTEEVELAAPSVEPVNEFATKVRGGVKVGWSPMDWVPAGSP